MSELNLLSSCNYAASDAGKMEAAKLETVTAKHRKIIWQARNLSRRLRPFEEVAIHAIFWFMWLKRNG
ncbi:hypothetical protein LINPERHAP1_LOCUS14390, partial [Linum perenne]